MGITNPESSAFDAVELEDSVLKASLPIKPPLTSSNLHGLVNFRHSQPGLQILTIRTTDCIHFLLPTISSLLLFDNMPLHHENTLVCHGTLSACYCGGYHAISPGKKWYEKYTTLDNQKASSQSEALNCHYFSKNHSEALSCVSCASFHYWFTTGEPKSYISSICLDLLKSLLLLLEFLDLCFPFLSQLVSSTALWCLFRCFLSLSDLLLFSSNLFSLAFSLFCFAFLFSLSPFSASVNQILHFFPPIVLPSPEKPRIENRDWTTKVSAFQRENAETTREKVSDRELLRLKRSETHLWNSQ